MKLIVWVVAFVGAATDSTWDHCSLEHAK